ASDVVRRLVHVEGRDGAAEPCPDAVVVDSGGNHHDQHLIGVDRGRGHDLDLEGLLRWAVTLAPDGPGIHARRDMAQRRDLADLIEVLLDRAGEGYDFRCLAHAASLPHWVGTLFPHLLSLQCTIFAEVVIWEQIWKFNCPLSRLRRMDISHRSD